MIYIPNNMNKMFFTLYKMNVNKESKKNNSKKKKIKKFINKSKLLNS